MLTAGTSPASTVRATWASTAGQSIAPSAVYGTRTADMPVIVRPGWIGAGRGAGWPRGQEPMVTGGVRPRMTGRPGDRGRVGQRELGEVLEPHLQRHLHAGEVRADATVDAEAEGRVAVHLAVDHDLAGLLERRGSRLADGNDRRTQSSLHRAAVPLHVVPDQAGHGDEA